MIASGRTSATAARRSRKASVVFSLMAGAWRRATEQDQTERLTRQNIFFKKKKKKKKTCKITYL